MSTPPFVHLHMHTEYSLLDGAIRIPRLLDKIKTHDMHAVAVTDHGTLFGAIDFHEQAKKAGVKPIIGCECYLAPRRLTDKTPEDGKNLSHLVLLAETMEGYRNLCKLATVAQLEGFYYKPRIDKPLLQEHSRGLIALSACLKGEIPRLLAAGNTSAADAAAEFYHGIFGEGNFFLEIQQNGLKLQEKINRELIEMSRRLSIPLVATNDCHYLEPEDAKAHEVLLCIQTGKTMDDADRFRFETDALYLKSPREMAAGFKDVPEALANTVDIADRCTLEFTYEYHFPHFKTPADISPEAHFESEVKAGFARIREIVGRRRPGADIGEYETRLDHELYLIQQMGFAGYFLIVSDFIRHAKENGVPVGPGRGSAAGSLVAYSLGITDIDPLEHGLIFERFLNPARISMPDIDVDFCMNGREQVFRYVFDKYGGKDYVAQIITFGKLKTRAVIRDVGRAMGIPLKDVDRIAKMVPDVLNISLDDALKTEPRLSQMAEQQPEIAELIRICRTLEGLPRHASTHAAGVVISDKPLVEYLPLYRGKKDEVVTQYDMKIVEKIGLVKFDFLGLRNLTVIHDTLARIGGQGKAPPDLSRLDLEDEATYRLLSRGDTTGVFQLESSGMKDLLTRLRPAFFADVIALVALYRPGPLESGMVDDFVERKHGRRAVTYPLPELEPILKETYGVIVYQEQVMKIAGVLANYTMAEADGLRKAMGKKIPEIMARQRSRFIEGAADNQIPVEKAAPIFSLVEKFGGYGFNKSHSAAYALIAYQTAYLKAHYPVEFMASLLSSEMHSTDGVVKYIAECRSRNIPVLPPDINESGKDFSVDGDRIRFGLVAVKNVGEGAIDAILETRRTGRFDSLFDFCERVDLRRVNKRVIESLIRCGAFDSTGDYRARMYAALEDALEHGQRVQREKNDPQISLFAPGGNGTTHEVPVMPEIDEWDEKSLLGQEKEALGFYVTGHPLARHEAAIAKYTCGMDTSRLNDGEDGASVRIAGIVGGLKTIKTRKGENMGFLSLEDRRGIVEVTIFSDLYAAVIDHLTTDNAIIVEGRIQKDENAVKVTAEEIVPLEQAHEKWTAAVIVEVPLAGATEDDLRALRDVLKRHSGPMKTRLHLVDDETVTVMGLPDEFGLQLTESLTQDIGALAGGFTLTTQCRTAGSNGRRNGNGGGRRRA